MMSYKLVAAFWLSALWAQESLYLAFFQGKPDSLLAYPEVYLSPAALERRRLQGIPISSSDLPVSSQWIKELSKHGRVWSASRWLNAALVETQNPEQIYRLPFIQCIEPLTQARSKDNPSLTGALSPLDPKKTLTRANQVQLDQLKLPMLHQMGLLGRGIRVAILDAGFPYMDQIPAFRHLFQEGRYIIGYDFVAGDSTIFGDNAHGTQVASVIVAHDTVQLGYHGGAPQVSVILARTENALSESKIEEWNWARAAEWADSLGAHIIQSSLGYSTFDDPAENYSYADMNGQTAITTQAARIAAQKGLLVITSAGNEGNSPWRYITAPADADSVIAVGAINAAGQIAPFSSRGPTSDGRIKPDLVAMGWGTYIVGLSGTVQQASGTSFSAPLMTSLAACLWQAAPTLPGWAIREALIRSADRAHAPDTIYGYGLPDAEKAYLHLRELSLTLPQSPQLQVYPNPTSDQLTISLQDGALGWYDMEIYDSEGKSLLRQPYRGMTELVLSVKHWKAGLYFLHIISRGSGQSFYTPFVKL
ncbi:MAG: S8 family serine peptidase [Bacteroidia bacterium]|nr:S8 family serine peptidase [Bacteroidia bacterium]